MGGVKEKLLVCVSRVRLTKKVNLFTRGAVVHHLSLSDSVFLVLLLYLLRKGLCQHRHLLLGILSVVTFP
jgi:hypothetical protein